MDYTCRKITLNISAIHFLFANIQKKIEIESFERKKMLKSPKLTLRKASQAFFFSSTWSLSAAVPYPQHHERDLQHDQDGQNVQMCKLQNFFSELSRVEIGKIKMMQFAHLHIFGFECGGIPKK